ncbi:MAG: family 1 glycosylhydrolase [Candidatus Omnitrophica bacterium]|nr:family 1 glycosylhydrolase [Candidatus Omnitrophota bacterium]
MIYKFPQSFLWGASISSYQTEGNNFNCDWYEWEKLNNLEPAASASNHYFLFKEDFSIAKKLNLNAIRFSFEWSRLCSEKTEFVDEPLRHYRLVIDTLIELNLEPFVTLHHFTNPIWFIKKDGWLVAKNIDFFLKYLTKIVSIFKDKVKYWLIFNEPLVYIYNGFIRGIWPPGKKSFSDAKKVLCNIIDAYKNGYEEIKRIYAGNFCKVSFSKHLRFFRSCPNFSFGLNKLTAKIRDNIFNFSLLDKLCKNRILDFLSINYYCKEYTQFFGIYGRECPHDHKRGKNCLGWYVYPKGLYILLFKLAKFNLPIIITENGTAENNDKFYKDYLISHLLSVAKAIEGGVKINGYFWWSLIDNYEWEKGFRPRFGLVEVNYETFERKIKPFAFLYAKICKENQLIIR